MTVGLLLVYVGLGLGGLALVMFPESRRQLKILTGGFIGIFIEDKAKTPEGARAIFQQAIVEGQKNYNLADDTLKKLAGTLRVEQDNILKLTDKRKDLEKKCEELVKVGKIEDATILADSRDELLLDIKHKEAFIAGLEPKVEQAKMLHSAAEKKLKQLKLASKQVVNDLTLNKELNDMYDDMDALKQTKAIDKLLESVNDGVIESQQKVTGAQVVYNNKLETKTNKALAEADKVVSSDYIDQLKQKYNSNGIDK